MTLAQIHFSIPSRNNSWKNSPQWDKINSIVHICHSFPRSSVNAPLLPLSSFTLSGARRDPLALRLAIPSLSHVHHSTSVLALLLWSSVSILRPLSPGTLRAISLDRARVNLHSHFESRTINGRYRIAVTGVILRRYELIGQETIRRRYFSSAPRARARS